MGNIVKEIDVNDNIHVLRSCGENHPTTMKNAKKKFQQQQHASPTYISYDHP